MWLNLKKPIVFFDLETTGINISYDRIIEISMIKVHTDGSEEERTYRINPTIPISEEATRIHGITNADVAHEPTFKDFAPELNQFLHGCDFGGFNSNKFDFPLLVEEFFRADIDFDTQTPKFIDVQRIFHIMEPRNLAAAFRFYCGEELVNAHSAAADNRATLAVFKAQLDRYEKLEREVETLHKMSGQSNLVDLAGRMVYNDKGVAVFNFGKHRGKPVLEILKQEPSYYDWMMNGDFPHQTKKMLTKIRLSELNQR